MKKLTQLLLVSLVVTGALFTSCVKDEALNVEADIVSAAISNGDELLVDEPQISNEAVLFKLYDVPLVDREYEDGEELEYSYLFAPTFVLSKGATIEPESGTERDFSTPQTYVVTSEDELNQKTYTVTFFFDNGVLTNYSFEEVEVIETEGPEGYYHEFYSMIDDYKRKDWDTGNFGYNILAATLLEDGEELAPNVYPTYQTESGYKGKGVKMQTKSTGFMGTIMSAPLAAGNLFLGTFKFSSPAIESTRFGQPYIFDTAPKAVTGYFKYKAGDNFQVNNEPTALEKDTWDAYAILFEKRSEANYLLGNHNFEDSRMVSVARLDDAQRIETDEWTKFEINFEDVAGKSFDPSKEYMFTIVFSASKEGAIFNGAVGSQLSIDEVEIILAD